jgi:hypothetical protein
MDMDVSVGRITELPAALDVLIELSHEEASSIGAALTGRSVGK